MFERHAILGNGQPLGDEVLDEIEGKSLVVIEHPDTYSLQTVAAARRALEAIRRMRGAGQAPLRLSA
ncbi:MAG: hypothetical protein Q7R40_05450 [Phaeospirillum sp.]|nr:hypothetical protein [Phaeospirillum sp.]